MVGIDTGGTFTDGFFTRDGDLRTAKVLTTPHDLTVCLADCVREGARQFGVSVQDMLADTDIVRYSTTVSVNTIIQRTGAKIGLLVSQGFRDSLYSSSAKEVEPIFSFIAKDMIADVDEEIDNQGNRRILEGEGVTKYFGGLAAVRDRQRISMGRYITEEEVAEGVLFLVSDKASAITGAALPIDGGFLAV